MAINKTLLRRVRNHILEEPRRYDQNVPIAAVSKKTSPCGTQACLLGWAVLLSGSSDHSFKGVQELGAELLGLGYFDAQVVYYGDWPENFQDAFDSAQTAKDRARVAADYINYIIRTEQVD